MRLLTASVVSAAVALAAAAATAQTCPGDCGGDGAVAVDELVKGVNIALGTRPLASCTAMDDDGDDRVSIAELVRAVTASLRGCAALPTASTTEVLGDTATPTPEATAAASATATATDAPPTLTPTPGGAPPFCELPGSLRSIGPGQSVVPGGAPDAPDLSFIQLPVGFCVHYYGKVGNTRQLRFSPSGELFVASPTRFTTSDGGNPAYGRLPGLAAIVVLPDDDHDGTADAVQTYLDGKPDTVGLLFNEGYLYYQDLTRVMRVPYAPGDRTPSGASEEVANIGGYQSSLHWTKIIDRSDDGTIYVTNGADEGVLPQPCDLAALPFEGGILKLQPGAPGGVPVARGFRNPVSLRCLRGHNRCFAIELTRDYSTPLGGREKLIPVREGDHWGFPCCATKDRPYDDLTPAPDCSGVAAEIDSFFVGNTPFDLDFELGRWPEPWGNRAYVALHGAYISWIGARLVGIEIDAMTGQVLPGSDLPGMEMGAMVDFATGWEGGTRPVGYGRPTVVAFAPDGRLFMGNDTSGDIIWIAPIGLRPSSDS